MPTYVNGMNAYVGPNSVAWITFAPAEAIIRAASPKRMASGLEALPSMPRLYTPWQIAARRKKLSAR